jgi:D-glycero-D-manno-heptose 1,7-bisphosphate phosphatase
MMERCPAVFLDRNGVINGMWWDAEHGIMDSPSHPGQFHLLPHAGEAIQMLRNTGYLIVVVSNQPGIAKGKMKPHLLEEITRKMHADLEAAGAKVDAVYYCLHHPDAVLQQYRVPCHCRKPKPGLLQQAGADLNIDFTKSFMIGDGLTDVQAGKAARCKTIWLGKMKCHDCQIWNREGVRPDFIAEDLLAGANLIRGIAG